MIDCTNLPDRAEIERALREAFPGESDEAITAHLRVIAAFADTVDPADIDRDVAPGWLLRYISKDPATAVLDINRHVSMLEKFSD